MKEEQGNSVPDQRQAVAVIHDDRHTNYSVPVEPTIEPWNSFFETQASVLQEHPEEIGAIDFEPECSVDFREYSLGELVALQAQAAGGLLLTAPAGTGKTYLARRIAEHLREAGQTVHCAAPTHVAARLCGGKTIAHVEHWKRQLNGSCLLVDEASMISREDLGIMASWQAVGCHFIFIGDFDGQLLPFVDRWSDATTDVQTSQLMHQLCGGTHAHLQIYRRGRDPELFRFYTELYGTDLTQDHAVYAAVQKGQERYKWWGTKPDVCLCLN